MEKVLSGILKYRNSIRIKDLKKLVKTEKELKPQVVFFTCMDNRVLPTKITSTDIGDMYIVRNAGNLIPHSNNYSSLSPSTEPAALQLGCIMQGVRHVVVCGHSDCKAMKGLHGLEKVAETPNFDLAELADNPMKAWLYHYGASSLRKFHQLEMGQFKHPLIFQAETPMRNFIAYIDPENKLSLYDKLSQVNCLQQLQNIASYSFLKEPLMNGEIFLHTIWYDVSHEEFQYFSRKKKRFIEISEDTYPGLLEEVLTYV